MAQNGIFEMLNSPVAQGLLAGGLGALASRGSTAQAIGRGGLLGMSAYGQAAGQQENKLLEAAKQKMRDDAFASIKPKEGGGYTADWGALLKSGQKADALDFLHNAGRDKFKQMQEVTNQDGTKSLFSVNEYGGVQNTGLSNAADIKTQDLGGAVAGINPYTGQQAWSADKSATIGERETARHNRASEGVSYGNLALSRDRLAMDRDQPRGQIVDTPAGMMIIDPRSGQASPVRDSEGTPLPGKTGNSKPLPTAALKMVQEGKDAIGTASSINADLGAIGQQISSGKLAFGPISNLLNEGRNAAGLSNEQSRNFASFKASLEKLRNDSLRLNKGVQTDGDAQRAWNELFQNINDTALVQQRLGEIQRINDRAVQLRQMDIDGVLQNYGRDPMDTSAYANQPSAIAPSGAGGAAATRPATAAPGRTIVRTGNLNGRKVVQYSDGSTSYAD